jgi:chromosome partitioning protein
MHTLAFVNQKGGCGKTTTAVHLAGALASRGDRVLLADLDPQGHATMALGHSILGEPSMRELLLELQGVEEVVRAGPGGNSLLPADASLSEFEELAARRVEPEQALRRGLAAVAEGYDFALLDCPPRTEGVLAANALRAADTAVLVVESGAFALQGARQATAILEELAVDMECAFDLRVVGTLFDRRTRFARELLVAMQARFGELLFDTVIHTSVRLREAAAVGLPVSILDPTCRAGRDFEALAEEVRAHARRRAAELAPRRSARPAPPRSGRPSTSPTAG